jgi:hypothetical protein
VASTFVRLSIFHAGECFSLVAPPPPLFVSAIAVRFDVISRWILPKVCSVLLHKLSMYIQYELGTVVAMGLQFIFVSCILFVEISSRAFHVYLVQFLHVQKPTTLYRMQFKVWNYIVGFSLMIFCSN